MIPKDRAPFKYLVFRLLKNTMMRSMVLWVKAMVILHTLIWSSCRFKTRKTDSLQDRTVMPIPPGPGKTLCISDILPRLWMIILLMDIAGLQYISNDGWRPILRRLMVASVILVLLQCRDDSAWPRSFRRSIPGITISMGHCGIIWCGIKEFQLWFRCRDLTMALSPDTSF